MAKDVIDFTGVSEEIRQRGKRVPPGEYVFKIVKHVKDYKGGDRSNPPYYRWTLQVVEGKEKGGMSYLTTSLKPEALFGLRNLIWSATGKNVAGKRLKFDPATIYGKTVAGLVEENEYKDRETGEARMGSSISDVRPVKEFRAETSEDEEEEEEEEDEEEEEEEEEEVTEDLEEVDIDDL